MDVYDGRGAGGFGWNQPRTGTKSTKQFHVPLINLPPRCLLRVRSIHVYIHHQIPPDQLRGCHITTQYRCGYWGLLQVRVPLRVLCRFFFLGGLGVSPSGKNFVNPPSDTCPRFWTKACPPLPPRFVPENWKNLKIFLCQIWLLLSSKVP